MKKMKINKQNENVFIYHTIESMYETTMIKLINELKQQKIDVNYVYSINELFEKQIIDDFDNFDVDFIKCYVCTRNKKSYFVVRVKFFENCEFNNDVCDLYYNVNDEMFVENITKLNNKCCNIFNMY